MPRGGDEKTRIAALERQIEEYRLNERRFRRFLEATNSAIWRWDVISDRTEWADGLYYLFGYKIDRPTEFDWWYKRIHPDDAPKILSSVERVLASAEETWIGEYRFLRSDGSYAWVLDRAYVERDRDGKAVAMLGAMLDITDRKQAEEALRRSEQRYRRLRESNVIGILTADRERVLEANEAFLKLVGHTEEDVRAGRLRWVSIIPPEYQYLVAESVHELEETGLMQAHEKEYLRSDGTRVPVMVGGAVSEPDPLCAILFVLDLSEVKSLEQRLREAQKWEMIGVLAGGIAHDFNNLLTSIMGFASAAQAMLPPDDPSRRYLDRVVESGDKAAKLTAQLLSSAGKAPVAPEPVNLSASLRTIEEQIRTAVPRHIDLSFELAENLSPVNADPGHIEQAVMTLVVNAVEAIGPDNPGRISIRTYLEDITAPAAQPECAVGSVAQGQYDVLEIGDTGHGIAEESIPKIFDPFYTTKFLGRGLGLAAIAGIIRMHNGAIQVISAPQSGAVFRILLPAA